MWECSPSPPGHISEAHFSKVSHALDPDTWSVPPSHITKWGLCPLEIHRWCLTEGSWHPFLFKGVLSLLGGTARDVPLCGREGDPPHQTPPLGDVMGATSKPRGPCPRWSQVPPVRVRSWARARRSQGEMLGAQTLRQHSLSGSCQSRPSDANEICRTARANKKGSCRWVFSFQSSSKAAWGGSSWPFPSSPAFMHASTLH